MDDIHFGIIGGDRRSEELARLFREDGWTVRTWRIAGQGIGRSLEGQARGQARYGGRT